MASRLRGMTILSSTIIPRVQRLLDTGVLKERPVWLDAVEAIPPLPHPTLPQAHKTGKSLIITYPQDKRRKLQESMKSENGRQHGHEPPISLFESRVVKEITQWPRPVAVMNLPSSITDMRMQSRDIEMEAARSCSESSISETKSSVLETESIQPGSEKTSSSETANQSSFPGLPSSLPADDVCSQLASEAAAMSKESLEVDVESEQALAGKADDQPTLTVYVQQKASSNFEDTVSELSELLKTYEK